MKICPNCLSVFGCFAMNYCSGCGFALVDTASPEADKLISKMIRKLREEKHGKD